MSNIDEKVPADQFERVVREMRKAALLLDEIQHGTDLAKGVHKFEAQRALDHASACVEVAQYWLSKAIREAVKAGQAGNDG